MTSSHTPQSPAVDDLVDLTGWSIDDGADVEGLKALLQPNVLGRFFGRVERRADDQCWPWVGPTVRDGRGTISVGRTTHTASRVSLALHSRRWPPSDIMACHECDNPNCVNPKHLWWGTNADNIWDASLKGRLWNNRVTHCPQGHPLSGDNVYIVKKTQRRCKACGIEYQRRRRAARREQRRAMEGATAWAT